MNIEIVSDNMIQSMSTKLYKYQSFTVQTLENLKKMQLWFSKPDRFNDPFDPVAPYPSKIDESGIQKLYEWIYKSAPDKSNFASMYLTDGKPNDSFKNRAMETLKKVLVETGKLNTIGICCFSEINNDILMWAHYANGHRGFCLEFDARAFPIISAKQVVYSKVFPLFNFVEIIDEAKPTYRLILTKSEHWNYEKEWRVIIDNGDSGIIYDKQVLTGIYFGSAMPDLHKEILGNILSGSNTKIYEMKISSTEYKVTSVIYNSKN